MTDDWLPANSLDVLRIRAAAFDVVRGFFREHGYLEVDTPCLSRDVVVDAHLEPFVAGWEPEAGRSGGERFLQTSPEFHMKRLVAFGVGAIWQASRVFRQGELGRWHEPEFTMLEWYRMGDTHREQMAFTEELVRTFFAAVAPGVGGTSTVTPSPPGERGSFRLDQEAFERLSYDGAFERYAGTRVLHLDRDPLIEVARRHDIHLPEGLDRDGLLNVLLLELVEPHLGRGRPTFLYDYPASQAALARVRDEEPPVAERFELYVEGIELANGYHELTDADELRRRIDEQNRIRERDGRRTLPAESRLLDAMEAGLPACSGVALGFDRLLAIALGASSVAKVIPFPFARA